MQETTDTSTPSNRPAPRGPLFQITPAAAKQVKHLMQQRDKPSKGLRIGVKTRGCSGLQYTLEYVDEINEHDERVDDQDITVLIDPKAVLFVVGTIMDYVGDEVQSGFIFKNPNEKGKCGCGESFHV